MVAAPERGPQPAPVFRRVLLKLSGEALMGSAEFGLDAPTVDTLAREPLRHLQGALLSSAEGHDSPRVCSS